MSRRQRVVNAVCILVMELCERLTLFGIVANLVLFCRNVLKLDSPWPSTVGLLLQGMCYLTPLLGGWLADTYLGRFNTIFGSALLYFAGVVLLAAVSIPDDLLGAEFDATARTVYFVVALGIISFCTGGIKANVSPFGADQVKQDGPGAVQTFYSWFYWFINIGALIAYTAVVWLQQTDVFSGYAILIVTILLAMVAFLARRNKYVVKPPGGSQLTETAKIIWEAITKRKQNTSRWMDGAKIRFGGSFGDAQVEDVKALLRVVPVFITFIVYFVIFSQMGTTFLIQGTFMRLQFDNFTIPAASLTVFDIVIVLVLAPLMEHGIYPLLERIGIKVTPLRRIGVGFLIAAASMVAAGLVEIKRREVWQAGDVCRQIVFGEVHDASCFSVIWQAPEFLLIGASEVLANSTGLEFAYSQAPEYLKGVVMALYMAAWGLGSFLANLLVAIVTSGGNSDWYPEKDPNRGRFEYFFFLVAGLQMLDFLLFLYITFSYEYKGSPQLIEDTEEDQEANELTVSTVRV
ncbi:Solute carrier family 15 member 4 [Stylophora pistillata]|uniref:Solute carrier family 15 member 4 n=2 Tax=Stylophora pistillata TaxID=50429 RepID=A0A2B4S5U3_STYPI|nr:Solute carrier family 15 member 4 [Stylophora pistillata]